MTRVWERGMRIEVHVGNEEEPKPMHFVWQHRSYVVEKVEDDWHEDKEWWRWPICRDYFLLRTTSGMLVEVYQDLITHEWYFYRLYD